MLGGFNPILSLECSIKKRNSLMPHPASAVKPFLISQPSPVSPLEDRPTLFVSDLAAEMHSEESGNKTVDVNATLCQQAFWREG